MKLIPGYEFFYLEGREERALKADIDTTEIAKEVCEKGGSIHELLHAAVTRRPGHGGPGWERTVPPPPWLT